MKACQNLAKVTPYDVSSLPWNLLPQRKTAPQGFENGSISNWVEKEALASDG